MLLAYQWLIMSLWIILYWGQMKIEYCCFISFSNKGGEEALMSGVFDMEDIGSEYRIEPFDKLETISLLIDYLEKCIYVNANLIYPSPLIP